MKKNTKKLGDYMNNKLLREGLKQIIARFGIAALHEERKTIALFDDFVPDGRVERNALRQTYNSGAMRILLSAIEGSLNVECAILQAVGALKSNSLMDEAIATWLVNDLCFAIGLSVGNATEAQLDDSIINQAITVDDFEVDDFEFFKNKSDGFYCDWSDTNRNDWNIRETDRNDCSGYTPDNSNFTYKRTLPVYFVINASNSNMRDGVIAMENVMNKLFEIFLRISRKMAEECKEIKVKMLKFSSKAEWTTNGLVPIDDFYWNSLDSSEGTEVSIALKALHEELLESRFSRPFIIFLIEGMPTDTVLWENTLKWVNTNNIKFQRSFKIAIPVGGDAYKEEKMKFLGKLVGNYESVLSVDQLQLLEEILVSNWWRAFIVDD